jgi:hypothetical protein
MRRGFRSTAQHVRRTGAILLKRSIAVIWVAEQTRILYVTHWGVQRDNLIRGDSEQARNNIRQHHLQNRWVGCTLHRHPVCTLSCKCGVDSGFLSIDGMRCRQTSARSIVVEHTHQTDSKVCGLATEPLLEVTRNLFVVALAGDKGGTKESGNEGSNDFHSG